jgi:16S rRNA (cytosine1402-N4)-methyltransferase
MDVPEAGHEPVLLHEVLEWLDPQPGRIFVDCTLGRGGHAQAIAERLGPAGTLIALDVDPKNLDFAQRRLANAPCRIRIFHANFAELTDVLAAAGVARVDGLLADLGLSTNQFLDPSYGITFAQDGPLDMRIDPRLHQTAADLVNQMREDDLADVLYELAQERYSRRIASKIVQARRVSPITSTLRLAELVRQALPSRAYAHERIDPATRTFMALRIKVNRELENLESLLKTIPTILNPGGRAGVISFHSTEDRMVKQAFRSAEQTGQMQVLTRKPVSPTDEEASRNPRSRSAKLRVAAYNGR